MATDKIDVTDTAKMREIIAAEDAAARDAEAAKKAEADKVVRALTASDVFKAARAAFDEAAKTADMCVEIQHARQMFGRMVEYYS